MSRRTSDREIERLLAVADGLLAGRAGLPLIPELEEERQRLVGMKKARAKQDAWIASLSPMELDAFGKMVSKMLRRQRRYEATNKRSQ